MTDKIQTKIVTGRGAKRYRTVEEISDRMEKPDLFNRVLLFFVCSALLPFSLIAIGFIAHVIWFMVCDGWNKF